jgi:hypothetical protein
MHVFLACCVKYVYFPSLMNKNVNQHKSCALVIMSFLITLAFGKKIFILEISLISSGLAFTKQRAKIYFDPKGLFETKYF